MSSFLSNTMENPNEGMSHDVPSNAIWDTGEPTGPIEPISELSESPVDDPDYRRVRRNPWLIGSAVLAILFLVFFGIGISAYRVVHGSWGLPWVTEYPPLPAASAPAAPPAPSSQAPPPQAAPKGPVAQGIPTRIVVRRGETMIINTDIVGVYDCPSAGSTIDPHGDKPFWLSCSSQVGDGMTIPAVIVGHAENGNPAMPFGALGLVHPGDVIDITVPAGSVSFQVDTNQTPEKGQLEFGPENDVVKLVSCDLVGHLNVVISGHRIS